MTKITRHRTLEMMHMPTDSGMNLYFGVVLRGVLHGAFNKLLTVTPVRWMSLNNRAWSRNDYVTLDVQSSKQAKLNLKLLRDLCANTVKERK